MMVSGRRDDMTLASYLSPKTVVGQSRIAGRGLFAAAAIAKGEIVCVKGGHLLSKSGVREAQRRGERGGTPDC